MKPAALLDLLRSDIAKLTAPSLRVDFSGPPLIERKGTTFPLHRGQQLAWDSTARTVAIVSGTRAGKTCLGPHWVLRELQRAGGGDALIVGPTYPLMDRRLVPECQNIWQFTHEMGEYKAGRRCFEFNEKGLAMLGVKQAKVWFAFAEDPESLESMEAVCIWRDETGQSKFSRAAQEALDRRISMDQGRVLDTSTPYSWNWFKYDIFDRAAKWTWFDDSGPHEVLREGGDPLIEAISYRSIDNPEFPYEEWERQQGPFGMPPWKFEMMYCGKFTRPAGVVFDCLDEANLCKRFEIPEAWRRYAGHDFGPVHTAGVWVGQDPESKVFYLHSQYLDGGKAVEDHAKTFHEKSGGKLSGAWGGTWSEDTWRNDFSLRGYPINRPAIKDLKEGIQRLYAMLKAKQIVIFDDLPIVQDLREYSYELDKDDQPIEDRIESKNSWHAVDSLRALAIALYAQSHGGMIVHRRLERLHD